MTISEDAFDLFVVAEDDEDFCGGVDDNPSAVGITGVVVSIENGIG